MPSLEKTSEGVASNQPPPPPPPPPRLLVRPRFNTSRNLFLARLLAFTESFASCQCFCLSVRLTSHANDFVNATKATGKLKTRGTGTSSQPTAWQVSHACSQSYHPGFPRVFSDGYAMLISPNGAKQLSMAATARVIWLCACMRYWPYRGPWGTFFKTAFVRVQLYK